MSHLNYTVVDLLHCPICFEDLSIPVFQHAPLVVLKFKTSVLLALPLLAITDPMLLRRLLNQSKTLCKNKKYGCAEMVFRCSAKCFCYNCNIPISFLELHQKCIILQEEQEGTIFILNHGIRNLGTVTDVCHIAPSSPKRGFSYDILATNGGRSVKLQSFAEHVSVRVEHTPSKSFLVVPRDFYGSGGQLKLEVSISPSLGVVHA
ncbi:hypothetical protein Vadar_016358 [Vaccinium darrowii]|uniref:Uncharacterized protein n=1 Tax=Vaccinium darrowii TaxID=229202 RepID=A0ACB7YF16_9ERIC|nr:hypothetical protein Vadar_016358 [Vaccinium darrowii]